MGYLSVDPSGRGDVGCTCVLPPVDHVLTLCMAEKWLTVIVMRVVIDQVIDLAIGLV